MTNKRKSYPFSRLESASEVQRAIDEATSNRIVVFLIHVDWAPMKLSHHRFAEFEREFKLEHPKSSLQFRYIDCTSVSDDYGPLRCLKGWQEIEAQRSDSSLVHGYGELAWCKEGRVVDVQDPFNFATANALIDRTIELGLAIGSD